MKSVCESQTLTCTTWVQEKRAHALLVTAEHTHLLLSKELLVLAFKEGQLAPNGIAVLLTELPRLRSPHPAFWPTHTHTQSTLSAVVVTHNH